MGIKSQKDLFNPIVLFFGLWGIITLLSSLHLFGLKEASNKAYIIILVGLLGFLSGFLLIQLLCKKTNIKRFSLISNNVYEINYNVMYVLLLISIIYTSFRVYRTFSLLAEGYGLFKVRLLSFEPINRSLIGLLDYYFRSYFIKGIVYICVIVAAVDYFAGKKDKKLLIMTLILVLLSSISSGGRLTMYNFIIVFLFALIIFRKNSQIQRKYIYIISVVFLSLIISMYVISIVRKKDFDLFRTLYVYFASCIPFMEYHVDIVSKTGEYVYGMGFFSGIIKPILLFLSKVGILDRPDKFNLFNELIADLQNVINLGDVRYNAFVTLFYYFYFDFGHLGVLLGSLMYGAMSGFSYLSVKKKLNYLNVAIYLLIVQGMFTSMIRWAFSVPAYVFAFGYLLFAFKKTKHRNQLEYESKE